MITITPLPNVEGTATISVEASDGNGGTAIDTFTVAIDTLAPNAPTNVRAESSPYILERVTVSWTASNSTDVSYHELEVENNGAWIPVFISNNQSSYNYTMSTNSASFRVFAIDNVGNKKVSDIFTLTLP